MMDQVAVAALSEEWQRGGTWGSTSLNSPLSAIFRVPGGQLGSRHYANISVGSCSAASEGEAALCLIFSRDSVVRTCGGILFFELCHGTGPTQYPFWLNGRKEKENRCGICGEKRRKSSGNGKWRSCARRGSGVEDKENQERTEILECHHRLIKTHKSLCW